MKKVPVLACVLSRLLYTPGQPVNPAEQPTISVDINLIVMHATVLDRSGRPVSGLDKQAFRLFVDGRPRPITLFQTDDAPVTAGILVDNSASMMPKGSQVLAAALAFARASNPQDQMFVVHFSDQVRFALPAGVPFTGSILELETALGSFNAAGATALYDAVALALLHLKQAEFERKILLIISDGGDNSSQKTFEDVVKLAQTSGVVVYCIGIYDDANRDRNPRVLSELAELTGGRAFYPAELKDVENDCVEIARDIRRQYTLGFEANTDGEYHRITLTALHPGLGELEVHTRTGYFAPKP